MTTNSLIETMEWRLSASRKAVAEFTTKLAESNDPLYELSWATDTLRVSAEVSVIAPYLKALQNDVPLEKLTVQLRGEVMRSARCPESSTSPIHNVCGLAAQSARADLLEQFESVEAK